MSRETELEEEFSWIPWRKPVRVTRTDGVSGFACRFCIAIHGLKARDIPGLFQTEDQARTHIREVHEEEK